jgi:hypothetical protein
VSYPNNRRSPGRFVLILAAVVLFGWAFLAIFLEGGGSLAPGRCSTGLDIDLRELFGK